MRPYVVFALVGLLTACGGSSDEPSPIGESAATTTVTASVPSVTTDAVTTDAVAATGVDPCDLLTLDEVTAVTGLQVVAVVPSPPVSCLFDFGDEVSVDIFVTIEDGEGRLVGAASLLAEYRHRAQAGEAMRIEGLAAEAVFDGTYRAIAVDAGSNRLFAIGVSGGYAELADPRDVLVELARRALERV